MDAAKNTIPSLAKAMESLRAEMINFLLSAWVYLQRQE